MMKEIAERLRGLRDSVDLSADEMAKKTGISPEEYLRYESGDVDIPMNYVCQVAALFKLDTAVLISGDDTHAQSYFVTRKGLGVSVERNKAYKYRDLAGGFKNAKATPFLVTVEPNDEPIHLNTHPGQEFNLVEKGRMLLQINDKEIILETGDSIYFDATQPHGMKALDNAKARFLAIIL
ncbi:MAG: helix-turn-helix transcriptional regulator [Paludibacteraceae bacterium]|nr:helix-turn-helix transcriptional regulator [Paludibacteraceae bacterium]